MGQPMLEDDHESVGELVASLRATLAGADVRMALGLLDILWARLAVHIRAEHLCLFPAILRAPSDLFSGRDGMPGRAEVEATVERLREDHNFFMREIAAGVGALRGLLTDPEGRDVKAQMRSVLLIVEAVASRLDVHNKLEEQRVYRWAGMLLNDVEQARLTADVRRELANSPARFTNTGEWQVGV